MNTRGKIRVRRSYGRHIERLSDGHSSILIYNPSEALNLKKFIKNNMGLDNLVVEPQAPNLFTLTWHHKPPKKVGESVNYLYFDFGDLDF